MPRIDIRGLRTRNILLLLDGVPLNSAYDGQFDPRSIPVENIAKIKVTKGGSSVLYGPGGNAAVIDIITKSAAAGLHGSGQIEYNPDRSLQGRATTSYGGKNVRVFLSASALDQDYWRLSDDFASTNLQGPGKRLNSDREDKAFYANSVWTPSANASFGLSLNYREGEYGKPPGTISRQESPFAQRTRFERVDHYDTFSIQSASQIRFTRNLSIRPTAYFNMLDEVTNNFDDATFSTQNRGFALHQDCLNEHRRRRRTDRLSDGRRQPAHGRPRCPQRVVFGHRFPGAVPVRRRQQRGSVHSQRVRTSTPMPAFRCSHRVRVPRFRWVTGFPGRVAHQALDPARTRPDLRIPATAHGDEVWNQ